MSQTRRRVSKTKRSRPGFFSRLFGFSSAPKRTFTRRSRLGVESLESRWLMTADPDVVTFHTTQGDVAIELFSESQPITVNNFLNYINSGAYDNSIIHRAIPGFIIQGGGFTSSSATFTSTSQFTTIPNTGTIQGEPGILNTTGTIAMALSSGPDSGTNNFFINLANNSALDDASNGGPFTVFGQVVNNTMGVVNTIAGLPKIQATSGLPFNTLPVSSGNQLVRLLSVSGFGTVQGNIFNDLDRSGVRDNGEGALVGQTVFADDNNNGLLDSGEVSATTDALGNYALVVSNGTHLIRQAASNGFKPASGSGTSVDVDIGREVTGVNFGDIELFARYTLQVTHLDGSAITAQSPLKLGEQFTVKVFVEDPHAQTTPKNTGVELAGLDLLFDADKAAVVVDSASPFGVALTFGADYQFFPSVDGHSDGLLDEVFVGHNIDFSTFAPAGAGQFQLFSVTMRATGTGTLTISADPSDEIPQHQTQVATPLGNIDLENDQIFFGSATVNVVSDLAAGNDAFTLDEDAPATSLNVLVNDFKNAAGVFSITGATAGNHGGIVSVADDHQSLIYTPAANFNGLETFTYTLSDGVATPVQAQVSITVRSINDPPTAAGETLHVEEDSTGNTLDVLANDSILPDAGETLTIVSFSPTTNGGTVSFAADHKSLIYTPPAGSVAADSFTYTINDGVTLSNATATVNIVIEPLTLPRARQDLITGVQEDSLVHVLHVLDNDTPNAGHTNTIIDVGTPNHGGTVTVSDDGLSLLYKPAANFFGNESFTYTIDDGSGTTGTGTVTVAVENVNDSPTAAGNEFTVAEDSNATTIDVLANDSFLPDPTETLAISFVGPRSGGGTVNVAQDGRTMTYKPAANFSGDDIFSYTISDGHGGTASANVTVHVTPVNDNPTAVADAFITNEDTFDIALNVLSNDSFSPDLNETLIITTLGTTNHGGTVTKAADNKSLLYTPAANFFGTETFSYAISDGNGGTATANVTITVNNVNDPPTATDDLFTITKNSGAHTFSVLANDSFLPDPTETLTVTQVSAGDHEGTIALGSDGKSLVYTPKADFVGTETFTYTISDGRGGTDVSTVSVNVLNFAPSWLAGFAYIDANNNGSKDQGESPLVGITITLTGTSQIGAVNQTLVTDAQGHYLFDNLAPGTYTITETQPLFLRTGIDSPGVQVGTAFVPNQIVTNLLEGTHGDDNNFGERGRQRPFLSIFDYRARGGTLVNVPSAAHDYLLGALDGAGTQLWLAPKGDWADATSVKVSLVSNRTQIQIDVVDANNVLKRATLSSNDPRVQFLGTIGSNVLGQIIGKLSDFQFVAVNRNPVIAAQSFNLAENSANNAVVGTVAASDPDAGQTLSFSITAGNGAGTGAFAIDNTGKITVQDSAQLDFETVANHKFQLTVRVTDNGSPASSSEALVTINLTDVNDNAPVITTGATQSVAENATQVAALTSTDADTVGTIPATFTVTGGADAALFEIVGGNLVFKAAKNFEADPHTYTVQVTANDGVNSTNKTITVNLTDVNDNGPVITTGATQSVAENATLVAALTSTDTDTVGTIPATFTITGGADAALFDIVSGNLVFKAAKNFEADPHTYTVQITANDGVNSTNKTITVDLTDLNDNAPVITTDATQSVAENATLVAALTSTDTDTVGTIPATFAITGGADAALFDIVSGNLVFKAAKNFEADPHTYTVQVTANDGVNSTNKTITVNLTDLNDNAPVITTGAAQSVAENATQVAALTSTDADSVGTNPATFTITGGADAVLFDIVGGNLVFKAAKDFEADPHSYTVQVTANDGVNSTNKSITVNLTDLNDNAPVISTAAVQSVAENTTLVAAVTSTDADAVGTNPATFTITGGADADLFDIVAGNLVFKAAKDFEADPHSYTVQVTANDGVNSTNKTITVNLLDVAAHIQLSASSIVEELPADTTVGLLNVTEDDAGETFTFSLVSGEGDDDNGSFAIDGSALKTAEGFDFEVKSAFSVRVRATSINQSFEQIFTINVLDANDNAPVITTVAVQSVAENTTLVAALTSTDADTVGTNPATFTITGGADADLFEIVGGNLVFKVAQDFETDAHSYAVEVTANDGANDATLAITVNLTEANDNAPVITTAAVQAVAEGVTQVAALTSTDADTVGTNPATFAITGGADADLFDIVDGNLVFKVAQDFEADPHTYTVQLTANDGTNTTDLTITVNLTDVNDNPPVITTAAVQSVAEGVTQVAALTSTDADTVGTNPATFTITGGADADLFEIVGGNLVFKVAQDFETDAHSYAVEVTANDGANDATLAITVNLTEANDNAPVITTAAVQAVAEGVAQVAALTSTDADTVGTNPATFTITGGADADLFEIVGGNLVFKVAQDFETDAHSYAVEVTANDGANDATLAITVNLTEANDNAPVITTVAVQSVAENTTLVAALTSTDADTVGTNPATFTITGGADADLFEIVGGNLVFKVAQDFETDAHSYAVEVTANDGANDATLAITVNLTDVNDNAPVITTVAVQSVAENTTLVAALTSTDADTVGTNPATFTITGGADADLFEIVGGNLVFKVAQDFETDAHSYAVEVTANDGANDATLAITVNLTDVNDNAPVITTVAVQSVAENTTLVAALTSTDADTVGTNPATFTITGGADADLFEIVGGNLVFKVAQDFETDAHSYAVEVTANDGANDATLAITVNLTDANEAPTIAAQSFSIDENSANDTVVGTVVASDPDAGQTASLTYGITAGNESGAFVIDPNTGAISVADATKLDFETTPSFALTVAVNDVGEPTLSNSATITINLNDLVEGEGEAAVWGGLSDDDFISAVDQIFGQGLL